MVATSGTMVLKQALFEAGLFRSLPRAEDLDMWVRVLALGPGVSLGRPTVRYHEHDGQSIHDRDLMRCCVEQIIDEAQGTILSEPRDVDRARSRLVWDDFRALNAVETRGGSLACRVAGPTPTTRGVP